MAGTKHKFSEQENQQVYFENILEEHQQNGDPGTLTLSSQSVILCVYANTAIRNPGESFTALIKQTADLTGLPCSIIREIIHVKETNTNSENYQNNQDVSLTLGKNSPSHNIESKEFMHTEGSKNSSLLQSQKKIHGKSYYHKSFERICQNIPEIWLRIQTIRGGCFFKEWGNLEGVLKVAKSSNKGEILRDLIKVGVKESLLHKALDISSSNGYIENSEILLQHFRNHRSQASSFSACNLALINAVEKGHYDVLCACIRAGVPIQQPINGQRPIVLAAKHGHTQLVEKMIQANVDVTKPDAHGKEAIFEAIENGNTAIVQLLQNSLNLHDEEGNTPLTRLILSQPKNMLKIARGLIDGGVDVNSKNQCGETALVLALQIERMVFQTRFELVALLVDAGADVNRKFENETPLMMACSRHDIENWVQLSSILLQAGADPNYINCAGESAVTVAAHLPGCLPYVRNLVNHGAKIDGKIGQRVLLLAAYSGSEDLVDYMICQGTDDLLRSDEDKAIFLENAVRGGNEKVVNVALSTEPNIDGLTPYFTRWDDDFGDSDEFNLRTPLWIACYKGYNEVCRLLIEKDASVHFRDSFGLGLLEVAAIDNNLELLEILLAAGADAHAPENAPSALVFAILLQNVDMVQRLVDGGADVSARVLGHLVKLYSHILRTNDLQAGQTPLMLAVATQNKQHGDEIINILAESGSCLDAQDCAGNTALHNAVLKGDPFSIIVLLKLGSKHDIPNETGITALSLIAVVIDRFQLFWFKFLLGLLGLSESFVADAKEAELEFSKAQSLVDEFDPSETHWELPERCFREMVAGRGT